VCERIVKPHIENGRRNKTGSEKEKNKYKWMEIEDIALIQRDAN
jgi:hypothetical protein